MGSTGEMAELVAVTVCRIQQLLKYMAEMAETGPGLSFCSAAVRPWKGASVDSHSLQMQFGWPAAIEVFFLHECLYHLHIFKTSRPWNDIIMFLGFFSISNEIWGGWFFSCLQLLSHVKCSPQKGLPWGAQPFCLVSPGGTSSTSSWVGMRLATWPRGVQKPQTGEWPVQSISRLLIVKLGNKE